MGKVIESGVIGKVIQITIVTYKDWIQRPWESHTLDPKRGGGVVYRQGPHQLDLVRYLAGGMAKSVRALVGGAHPTINVHGHHSAFFEFENDISALVTFNGYANLDTSEFTWNMGEGPGARPDEERHIPRPRATGPIPIEEFYALPEYNLDRPEGEGRRPRDPKVTQPNFFGLMIVSCEQGDMRQHPEGFYLYKDGARQLIQVPERPGGELRELVESIQEDRPAFPDHNWGRATLECCIGMIESSRQHREIELHSQSPSPVVMPPPLKADTTDYYATNILA
jgi:phthalate 4,5-cis-dihydrodiol dehydrogenase